MNERIQELLVEAHRQTKGGIYSGHPSEWAEKFAELIIRECMDLLEDYTTDIHVGGIQYNVVGASETLQEYFGVENENI
jgi:hypothetical protein